jgi:hypothetical protein
MTEELKPCPFCGGVVVLVESLKPWVKCLDKDCHQWHHLRGGNPREFRAELVRKWNTRHVEPVKVERAPLSEEEKAFNDIVAGMEAKKLLDDVS